MSVFTYHPTGYYVYAILDPTDDFQPFYIGKGKGWRWTAHFLSRELTFGGFRPNRSKISRILKIREKTGNFPPVAILSEGLSEFDAHGLEIQLIEEYEGSLTNQTDGGEGISGYKRLTPMSAESREKCGRSNRGKKMSEEQKQKISQAMRGRKQSIIHVKKRTISRWNNPNNKGRHVSEEQRIHLSEMMKGRKRAPESVAKSALGSSKYYWVTSPEGTRFKIRGLTKFAQENDMLTSNLRNVLAGKCKSHRGWYIEYVY